MTTLPTSIKLTPNLLIVGDCGQGKTTILSHILKDVTTRHTSDELKLILVSTNPCELESFENLPHLMRPKITDPKAVLALLDDLVKEAEARYELLRNSKCKSAEKYNQKHPGEMPTIVVAIDEIADIFIANKGIEAQFVRFFQRYQRASNIQFIIGATTSGTPEKWLTPEMLACLSMNKILLPIYSPEKYKLFPEIDTSRLDYSYIDDNVRCAYYFNEYADERLVKFEFGEFEEK